MSTADVDAIELLDVFHCRNNLDDLLILDCGYKPLSLFDDVTVFEGVPEVAL